jgi:threonine/homoserine/homoserine lactone efflux protein
MPELHPIVTAAITGFISGLLLSIPVGPINVTILNEGARRGFLWAALIGLGATVMEVIYCTIAFTGFASLLGGRVVKSAMELTSFVFMLYLGVKFLMAREVPATSRIEERIEHKLHPHSAFWTGLVRVMGNPGVLVLWVVLAANFTSREWVAPETASKLACIGGVAASVLLWFLGLSWAVSRGHKKLSNRTLLKMEHASGLMLLGIALAHGVHIVWVMARHRL